MKETVLVETQEQLHSLEDYLKGLDMILQHNEHFNSHVAPPRYSENMIPFI